MTPIVARRDATQRSIDRFVGRALDFTRGDDCGKMAIFHLREMGNRPTIGAGGTWKSVLGAKRFMNRHGGSIAAVLDGWGLPRILPAEAVIGDVIELPGAPPFGAVAIVVGNGRVLGWHRGAGGGDGVPRAAILQPLTPITAWRVHHIEAVER